MQELVCALDPDVSRLKRSLNPVLAGSLVGAERGFALRLQAQVALCQVSMEANTLELRQLMSPTPTYQPSAAPQATYQQSTPGYQGQAGYPAQPGKHAQPGQHANPSLPPGGYHQR